MLKGWIAAAHCVTLAMQNKLPNVQYVFRKMHWHVALLVVTHMLNVHGVARESRRPMQYFK
jgi:hypothetical protein